MAENLPGVFGEESERVIIPLPRHKGSSVSAERWADIIGVSANVILFITIAVFGESFSDGLFDLILPIITVGSRIALVAITIGTAVGALYYKFRRRRRRWL